MKIVHISAFCGGGAGHAAWKLHKGLLDFGIDSHFLTFQTTGPKDEKWHSYYTQQSFGRKALLKILNEFNFRNEKILGNDTRNTLMAAFHAATSEMKAEYLSFPVAPYDVLNHPVVKNADIINLHWVAGVLDYPSFFSRCRKPVVWTLHDLNSCRGILHYDFDNRLLSQTARIIDEKARKIKASAYRSASVPIQLVSPSAWLANQVRKSDLQKSINVKVIPYSINVPLPCKLEKNELKFKLGMPLDRPCLLFVASSVSLPRKGFSVMMDALAMQKKKFQLTVVGNLGLDLDRYDFEVLETGSIASIEALNQYYYASDALILPSIEDNLPNVMLEAMACGLPVVAFPVGGMIEHVRNEINGYLAYEQSVDGLAESIRKILDRRKKFDGREISKYAINLFSLKSQVESYLGLYTSLINAD